MHLNPCSIGDFVIAADAKARKKQKRASSAFRVDSDTRPTEADRQAV